MKNTVKNKLITLLSITGWNLQELSNRSNLPFDTVKNLYYGRIENPRIETLIAIADACMVSLDYLVGRIDYATNEMKYLTVLNNLSKDSQEIIELIIKHDIEKKNHN